MKSDKDILHRLKRRIKGWPLMAIPGIFLVRVLSGFRAYRKILMVCPPEKGWKVWFMDYDGSGDTYLTCGYLHFLKALGAQDAFAASGGLSRKIAELFPFGRYTQITPKTALNVRLMERFLGQKLDLLPLLYESDYLEYSGVMRRMAGWRGIDFMTMLKIGLEANCGIPFQEGAWEQSAFPYDPSEIDALFEHHGLIPGRTVLLAPYAGKSELWGVSLSFYEDLARRFAESGYTVCTNSSDPEREPPITGTVPLLVPHRLMRPFCDRAGYFIGLRSGLCDIVSGAKKCRMAVLYSPEMTIGGICSFKEFFSLKNMGLRTDAVELQAARENWDGQSNIEKFILE